VVQEQALLVHTEKLPHTEKPLLMQAQQLEPVDQHLATAVDALTASE